MVAADAGGDDIFAKHTYAAYDADADTPLMLEPARDYCYARAPCSCAKQRSAVRVRALSAAATFFAQR